MINDIEFFNSFLDCEVEAFLPKMGDNHDEYVSLLKPRENVKYMCPYL